MRRPALWRYYGLFCLSLVVVLVVSILNAIAIGRQIEWLRRCGVKGIGSLCVGLCFLLQGLDFVVLCKRYPPFLRENAPRWDTRSRNWSPALLFFIGVWLIFGGIVLTYTGGWYTVDAVLEVFPK